jgi:hypothetical protein
MKDTDYSLQVNLPPRDKPLTMGERLRCSHPNEILTSGLSIAEKREILSSWASDARAVSDAPALRTLDNGAMVGVHEILDALRALDNLNSPQTSPVRMNKFTQRREFLELLAAASRKGGSDDDDDPPPCPAVISPLPPLPPFGMRAELEAA